MLHLPGILVPELGAAFKIGEQVCQDAIPQISAHTIKLYLLYPISVSEIPGKQNSHVDIPPDYLPQPARDVGLGQFLVRPGKNLFSRVEFDQITQPEKSSIVRNSCGLLHAVGYDHNRVFLF